MRSRRGRHHVPSPTQATLNDHEEYRSMEQCWTHLTPVQKQFILAMYAEDNMTLVAKTLFGEERAEPFMTKVFDLRASGKQGRKGWFWLAMLLREPTAESLQECLSLAQADAVALHAANALEDVKALSDLQKALSESRKALRGTMAPEPIDPHEAVANLLSFPTGETETPETKEAP